MKTLTLNSSKSDSIAGYPDVSPHFEWAITLTSLWIFVGLYLDGWAHINISETIEDFFSPWHGVLYSGLFASIMVLGVAYAINWRKGYHWLRSLPQPYMTSLLGAVIFLVAGNLDLIWHAIFGFEENIEMLVSPSHLILAVGGVVMMSGPLRAAWAKSDSESRRMSWRAVLSLFIVVGVFSFFTQFSSAFAHPHLFAWEAPAGDTYIWDVTLISYVLIPTALFMSAILMTVLRWKLPVGSLTFLLAGNSTLMFLLTLKYSFEYWHVLIAALVGGILSDILLLTLKPSADRRRALRWFSFLVPALLYLAFFISLVLTQEIWWRSNMWLGMVFFSGVTGLGLSWLAVPINMSGTEVQVNGSDW